MYYKKAFFNFIKAFCFLFLCVFSIIYISDPYRLFHDKIWDSDKMYHDMRVQAYGLIKYQDFDNIVTGSSMMENTSAKEAEHKLGGTWINLSYSAQRTFERFKTLNYALSKRKINNIIIGVDYMYAAHSFEKNFEEKLYDDDIFTKWRIYLNSNAMSCIFLGHNCKLKEIDLDRPNMWAKENYHARRFGGFSNWLKFAHEDDQIKGAFKQLLSDVPDCNDGQHYKQIVDEEILPLFEHTDTTFHLIISPYSALYWAHFLKNYDCMMKGYEYLIERSQKYNNVHIYWLYDEKFVFDITKYKDLTHYAMDINSLFIDVIKKQSNIINTSNYKQKIGDFKKNLQSFNLDYYIKQINKYYETEKTSDS